jgi:hypothetical protein
LGAAAAALGRLLEAELGAVAPHRVQDDLSIPHAFNADQLLLRTKSPLAAS